MGVKTLTGSDQEVIIYSNQGQTIRLGLKDIPALGRATQGVRIMRLNSGDSVASLALVEKVEVLDEDNEEQAEKPPVKKDKIPPPPATKPQTKKAGTLKTKPDLKKTSITAKKPSPAQTLRGKVSAGKPKKKS